MFSPLAPPTTTGRAQRALLLRTGRNILTEASTKTTPSAPHPPTSRTMPASSSYATNVPLSTSTSKDTKAVGFSLSSKMFDACKSIVGFMLPSYNMHKSKKCLILDLPQELWDMVWIEYIQVHSPFVYSQFILNSHRFNVSRQLQADILPTVLQDVDLRVPIFELEKLFRMLANPLAWPPNTRLKGVLTACEHSWRFLLEPTTSPLRRPSFDNPDLMASRLTDYDIPTSEERALYITMFSKTDGTRRKDNLLNTAFFINRYRRTHFKTHMVLTQI